MSSPRVATFEKVSFKQFYKDYEETFGYGQNQTKVKKIFDDIQLPLRVTSGSAGYDFKSPIDFIIRPGETIKIPTGIRVKMYDGWVLQLFPRSGLGFKYRLQLNNTVGIIDSDYCYSDNEGHIFAKITNDTNEDKVVVIKRGEGYMQGIFLPYGITSNDVADGVRNGGFGSTDQYIDERSWSRAHKKDILAPF